MNRFYCLLLLVVCITTIQASSAKSKERNFLVEGDDSCPREGIRCRDCHTVSKCVGNVNEGFNYVDMWTCPPNSVCDETQLACVPNGICRYRKFICPYASNAVLLPDPYSCAEYHECDGESQYDYVCDPGTSFDADLGECRYNLDNYHCKDSPIPLCEYDYQRGRVGNTFFSYECRSYHNAEGQRILYPVYHEGPLTTEYPWYTSSW